MADDRFVMCIEVADDAGKAAAHAAMKEMGASYVKD
jgi:hypothetical protein